MVLRTDSDARSRINPALLLLRKREVRARVMVMMLGIA